MAFLGFLALIGVPIIVTGGVTGIFHALTHDERAIEEVHGIIQINTTDLRGKDVQKLQGLQMKLTATDTALFSTGDFSVKGNVSVNPHNKSSKAFVSGGLSFQIPGLDTLTDGIFILVNQTAADDKIKDDFEKVYTSLREERSQPADPREAIARFAQVL